MIGLDTNVVIRYLVQDDPLQTKKANLLIKKMSDAGEIMWISQLVLCEIFWVLERSYKLSKDELVTVLSSLLQTRQIQVEQEDMVWTALRDYEKAFVGFPDCLIGRRNADAECSCTYTFDKAAAKYLPSAFKFVS